MLDRPLQPLSPNSAAAPTRRTFTYADRASAGRQLAPAVAALGLTAPVVLALVRGGLPVALPIAQRLHAPLDLLLVRKIGLPGNPELAMAAVAELAAPRRNGRPAVALEEGVMREAGAHRADVELRLPAALREIERRRAAYLGNRAAVALAGRDVVVVDDGIATGTTLRAALQALGTAGPARVVVAVPVAPPETVAALQAAAPALQAVICPLQPRTLSGVGAWYADFSPVEDTEVQALMAEADRTLPAR